MVSLLLHTIIISAIFPPNGVETPPSWNRLKRHHRPNSFPDSCLQELEFNAVKTIPVQPDLPLCGVVGGRDIRDVATINIPFQGWCNYDCGTSHKCVWVLKKCGWNYSVHQVLYYFLCIIIAATSPAGWRPTVTCSWCLSEWVTPLICYSSRMGRCTNDLHYIKIQKSPNQT